MRVGRTKPAEEQIIFPAFTKALRECGTSGIPVELTFPDKHVYRISMAQFEQLPGLSVATLLDLTNEKERTQKQNDFIGTVSHDMRAPLTLIKGYINMLEMVGSLNDQTKRSSSKNDH